MKIKGVFTHGVINVKKIIMNISKKMYIYKQTFQILFLLRPLKGMSELKHTDRTM